MSSTKQKMSLAATHLPLPPLKWQQTSQSTSERLVFYTRHKTAKYINIWASSMHTLKSIGACWRGPFALNSLLCNIHIMVF